MGCVLFMSYLYLYLYIVSAVPNNKIKMMSSLFLSLSCSFRFISDMQNYGTVNQSYSINV